MLVAGPDRTVIVFKREVRSRIVENGMIEEIVSPGGDTSVGLQPASAARSSVESRLEIKKGSTLGVGFKLTITPTRI